MGCIPTRGLVTLMSSIELVCPVCHDGGCGFCQTFREELGRDVPNLISPELRRDPKYAFEISRYQAIADLGLEDYAGYLETKPDFRARLMGNLLRKRRVSEYVNIGPGFGFLEEATDGMDRWAFDLCADFLVRLEGVRCVVALAERLPLATGCVPCLVSDSTFQTLVDREAFLCEAARVCAKGALFVLTVGYRANYPRKPQGGFNVLRTDEREVLRHYLDELGFKTELLLLDSQKEEWVDSMQAGDYLYVLGRKR